MTIYERAIDFIRTGDVVGLGSGRASMKFIEELGRRVAGGLQIRGVPTSIASENLAKSLNIPLVELADGMPLAVTVDGADEVAPGLELVKGWGRALVREKVVAAASKKLVILVGEEKLVDRLGTRGKIPVEVVPFALPVCQVKIAELGLKPTLWQMEGKPAKTDNGNFILDCEPIAPIENAALLEMKLEAIPGVVGTGFFLGMASVVLVGDESRNFETVRELSL